MLRARWILKIDHLLVKERFYILLLSDVRTKYSNVGFDVGGVVYRFTPDRVTIQPEAYSAQLPLAQSQKHYTPDSHSEMLTTGERSHH
jgi:hypothetical protein